LKSKTGASGKKRKDPGKKLSQYEPTCERTGYERKRDPVKAAAKVEGGIVQKKKINRKKNFKTDESEKKKTK